MLIELLTRGGKLKDLDIAKSLLVHDQSQIEYYTEITNNMVGRVLRNRDVVSRHNPTKEFSLIGYDSLTPDQIKDLTKRCQIRLDKYIESKGNRLFQHRRKSAGYISGTIRYDILKRSKFHCELCGISAEKKALEVDHIIPRNKGGSDDPSNLQALCYSCNAMKRDRDDTDFRMVRESYGHRVDDCLFCKNEPNQIETQNELAYLIQDGFPVTPGHMLVIPKRHTSDYFSLGQAEINACHQLVGEAKKMLEKKYPEIDGYNIGVNNGESAGQTIMHSHIHLIPRRKGDTDAPEGGVRGVIPGKMSYS